MNMYCDAFRFYMLIQLITNCLGYHWRDYHGYHLDDAFIAGRDINNKPIYIGQVFVTTDKHYAILPATIQQGKDIHVPFYGAQKADSFVQILCSEYAEGAFKWVSTNSTHIHLLPIGVELKFVWGGVESKRLVAIGRVSYQGSTVVGKVLSGLTENARMFFVHKGEEMVTKTYEVLTYRIPFEGWPLFSHSTN